MRKIKGSYEELTNRENYEGTAVGDYLAVTLTDEEDIPGVMGRLSSIYPHIMKLEYDNRRTRAAYIPLFLHGYHSDAFFMLRLGKGIL